MRYFKVVSNGYISQIGVGAGGQEISKAEYDSIGFANNLMPHAKGFYYRLREDLTWEEHKMPVVDVLEEEEEITDQEAYNIIIGRNDL